MNTTVNSRPTPGRALRQTRRVPVMALSLLALAAPGPLLAQPDGITLTAEDAVRMALEQDPALAAARSRLDAASSGVREARAPFNLRGEVAPAVGFTNGNALLSQQIDIGGRRAAQTRAATGLQSAAAAEIHLARLDTAAGVRTAYFDLVRAMTVEATAAEAANLAGQIRDSVRRRVEIGEAPEVQATRSEIEAARAQQETARARGESRGRLAVLNLLLGRPADAPITPAETPGLPENPAQLPELLELARRQRPELAVVQGLIEAQRGEVAVARSQRRPELFAELTSDIWSLDRSAIRSGNFGIQARLSFPLFDRGRLRAGVDRAEAGVREREAELASATRTLQIEIQRAAAELTAARDIALNYQTQILPRTQELLQATRAGFDAGLSSFLEVLEAQRIARLTQVEYLTALFEATRARIQLDRALGAVPGMASAPMAAAGRKDR